MDLAYREKETLEHKATLIDYADPDHEALNADETDGVIEHGWWNSLIGEEYAIAFEDSVDELECRDRVSRLLPGHLVVSIDGETTTYVATDPVVIRESMAPGHSSPVAVFEVDGEL